LKTCTTTSNKWVNNNRPPSPRSTGAHPRPGAAFFIPSLLSPHPPALQTTIRAGSAHHEPYVTLSARNTSHTQSTHTPRTIHAKNPIKLPLAHHQATPVHPGRRLRRCRRHAQKKCAGASPRHTQKKQAAKRPPARHYTGHACPCNHAHKYCHTTKTHSLPSCSHPVPAGNP
jgi:hypothetical protein